MKKTKIIIIAGPTGVGKTGISIEIAKRFNGEIVSADSMQIYKRMDVGTAKITEKEMENVPHHLLDIIEPTDQFSVADFKELAIKKIMDIDARGKLPIIVGGTGLYINSLLYEMDFNNTKMDPEYRQKLWDYYSAKGEDELFHLLVRSNPNTTIEKQNVKRVIRALEIINAKGSLSKFNEMQESKLFDIQLFILNRDREKLYENINHRVDHMFEQGLLVEVEQLFSEGINENSQSMKGIGYRQIIDYFKGNCTLQEASEKIKQESRRYAKRQITWFKRYKNGIWIDMNDSTQKQSIMNQIDEFISDL